MAVAGEGPPRDRSQVLIVTGGSRGIGAATALLASQRGYAVCVNYRQRRQEAEGVVRAIEGKNGRAIAVQADVSSEPDVMRLFETTERALGRFSGLVNNAATIAPQMRKEQ